MSRALSSLALPKKTQKAPCQVRRLDRSWICTVDYPFERREWLGGQRISWVFSPFPVLKCRAGDGKKRGPSEGGWASDKMSAPCLMVHTVWNLWAMLSFLLKLVSDRISAPRNHESPFHSQRQSGLESRCLGLGHVPKPDIHIPEDNVCGPPSRPFQVRKAAVSSFCQRQAGICACFLPLLSQFLPPKRTSVVQIGLGSPNPHCTVFGPSSDGDTCHPHTPKALGLRKLQVHPELEETDFLAGTPSTQPVSIRPRELECGPGLRSSGVQLRPCILQAEASLQAVEGRHCWSRFAAPSLEHRGAVASRGQQRPKMPLLLCGKAKKVSGQGPHVKYLKIKKERGERGKRREREEGEGDRTG